MDVEGIIKSRIMKIKDILLLTQPHIWLGWVSNILLTIHNFIEMSRFIKGDILFRPRDYELRYELYDSLIVQFGLSNKQFTYYEFGVGSGRSLRYWISKCKNAVFYGFDTFMGLPENWGHYRIGEMRYEPDIKYDGLKLISGLFQNTLPSFTINAGKKVIHFDADLFSSTLFVLTTLSPYLESGDILIFDEFNCSNDEFRAFKLWGESFYIKPKLIAQVNNYHQIAFLI